MACSVAIWIARETQAVAGDRAKVRQQLEAVRQAHEKAESRSAAIDQEAADVKAQIAARQPSATTSARTPSPSQQVRLNTAEAIRQNPELMAAAREADQRRIDRTYEALFRQLHLSAEQIRAFEEILTAETGLLANGYVLQAPSPDAGTTQQKLQALLGSGYDAYVQYRNSLFERSQVEQFAAEVAGVEPLSAAAAQRMLQLYADAHAKEREALHAQGGGGYGSAAIYGRVVPAARSVLTAQQFEVLKLVAARESGAEFDGR